MKKWALMLCLFFIATDVMAFRCGRQLVRVGDHKWDVLDKCGDPEMTQERTLVRGMRLRHPYGALEESLYEEVLIEEWVYNFGPRKFKQWLQFENGILKQIESMDYGD